VIIGIRPRQIIDFQLVASQIWGEIVLKTLF
jgi:hypothetical protein